VLVVVVAVVVALCLYYLLHQETGSSETPTSRPGAALIAREKAADEGVWAKEILAQACGRTFDALWDSVNATTNKFAVLGAFDPGEVLLPQWSDPRALPHGIQMFEPSGPGPILSGSSWRQWLATFPKQGWQLDNLEFRHIRFDVDEKNQPARSTFYFAARLTNPSTPERAVIEGDLIVDWGIRKSAGVRLSSGAATISNELWPVKRIDATHLTIKTRRGDPPFQPILVEQFATPERSAFIDPLLVYDLDGDGFPEIILAAENRLYRRNPQGGYDAGELCRYPPGQITSAVIADFDGDGVADLLCAKWEGLFLYRGGPGGKFDVPPREVWAADPPLRNALVLTCGDIDEDGDLDVFLAQYRMPDLGQVLRPYYYDANDGWPSYLLLNDGHGNFTDATESAGLGPKRWRRTYSASFVDLDGDGHLDLAVVSDFAGLDLYRNDGHGHFTDVTRQWVAESHAFGMSHALADFNADGRLDLLMIAMPSPTVDRLEHLGLSRGYSPEDTVMRPAMAYGNRLYLARTNGGFGQTRLNGSIARSGWSWGCSAFDFDNDGFPDVYMANGLQSKKSVREYEPEFWLHDIFVDESVDDFTASDYFLTKFERTRGSGWSYGGYEKNRLYLNQHAESFLEIGHLAGVALEQDCRNVVSDDLDADGREDLLVTTFEVWPKMQQTLRVYRNTLPDAGHWIGFRLREEGGGCSPVGARVTIYWNGHATTRQIVTGDSHRSQHSSTIHFGLGEATRVDRAEIRWSSGQVMILGHPEVDRYHAVYGHETGKVSNQ